MSSPHDLEKALLNLPLPEREAVLATLERSVSQEYDRLAAESVAEDLELIAGHLAASPATPEQLRELQARVDMAERGEASYIPWEEVRRILLDDARRG